MFEFLRRLQLPCLPYRLLVSLRNSLELPGYAPHTSPASPLPSKHTHMHILPIFLCYPRFLHIPVTLGCALAFNCSPPHPLLVLNLCVVAIWWYHNRHMSSNPFLLATDQYGQQGAAISCWEDQKMAVLLSLCWSRVQCNRFHSSQQCDFFCFLPRMINGQQQTVNGWRICSQA